MKTTPVIILPGGMCQPVNPFTGDDEYDIVSGFNWKQFDTANPPAPYTASFEPVVEETVMGELIDQHLFYEEQGWINGTHVNAQQVRKIFALHEPIKEEKALTEAQPFAAIDALAETEDYPHPLDGGKSEPSDCDEYLDAHIELRKSLADTQHRIPQVEKPIADTGRGKAETAKSFSKNWK